MNKNIGGFDKMARVIMGVVIIGLGFYFKSWWGAIGIISLFTAFIGWRPIYAPFKIHTNKSSSD